MMDKIMLELKRQLMLQQGLNPDHHVEVPELDTEPEKERARINANTTLRHLNWPLSPRVNKKCKTCGFFFVTEYQSIAYCSTLCAKEELAHWGIDWSDKPLKEHYGGQEPPGIIPPDALRAMAKVLELTGYTVIAPTELADITIAEVAITDNLEPDQDQPLEELEQEEDYLLIEQVQTQMMNETQKIQELMPSSVEFDEEFFSL